MMKIYSRIVGQISASNGSDHSRIELWLIRQTNTSFTKYREVQCKTGKYSLVHANQQHITLLLIVTGCKSV